MNAYLKNLEKIEFVVTNACTGRCKHCSQGEHFDCKEYISPEIAANAVKKIAAEYGIKTVMTFGGEPLLHMAAVCAVMTAATKLKIPKRQVITNGYFSKYPEKIREVAEMLQKCGVNEILLSVDAFHQETIPLDIVKKFAAEVKKRGIFICLSPAWLKSVDDENIYNQKTRELLAEFSDLDIPTGQGNIIFPEGNAKKYLKEYFLEASPENPYVEDPFDVRCISFCANGDVLCGNAYKKDIMEIIAEYKP